MENSNKNFFETMTEMQKKVVENFNDATEKMQKNFFGNNYMESDPFKKWYDSQMSFFNQNFEKKADNDPVKFFNNWMTTQMDFAKNWMETAQKSYSKLGTDLNNNSNMEMYNTWMETLNKSYSEMMKSFTPKNDAFSSFSGLFSNAQNYMKMYEIWNPMMNSLKDKTFTPELFKNMFKPELFKGMMDNVFNMQPESVKNYLNNFNSTVKENMEAAAKQGKAFYDSFSGKMHENLANGNAAFDQMQSAYSNFANSINHAFSPMMKLVSPGAQKDQMNVLNEMAEDMNQYSIINAKMQYMMYVTGLKAMEEVAETAYNKMNAGEEVTNFMNVYQEWLNINDKNFVTLFDSEEYSKLQSELNALDMRLKKNINLQLEKSFEHLPLINRSEMDALYKTIYDLKKQVAELVKMNKAAMVARTEAVKATETASEASAPKATAKSSAKKA